MRLRGTLFATLFVLGTLGFIAGCFATYPVSLRLFRRTVWSWSRFHAWLARHVLGVRVVVEGALPRGRAVLYAMKHEARFETIDLPRLLDEPVIFAKEELLRIPLWGPMGRRYGLVGIDREGGARTLRTMLRAAELARADDRPLIIYPEGTRVARGAAPPLLSGFAGLYRTLKLPVVPIAVDSGRAFPGGGLVGRPATITYRIGDPIPPGLPRAEIEARVHDAINALNTGPEPPTARAIFIRGCDRNRARDRPAPSR